MDEIEKRLRDAADNCIKHYNAWQTDKKVGVDRDALMESIHELRKVAARLEIDIAISERTEMGARPLPIPPHRSASRRSQGARDDAGGDDDSFGNQSEDDSGVQPRSNAGRDVGGGVAQRRQGRRPQGGSGSGNGNRG